MLKQVIRNVPNDYDDLKFVTDTMFSVMWKISYSDWKI
jgi:hypothetical protein